MNARLSSGEAAQLSYQIIARTWLPLALNWLMMAVEGPLLVGLLGRLPEATINLAVFSVAFSIALIVEAPIMMLLSSSAALATDKTRYEKLWRFASIMALPLSGFMGVIGTPAVFERLNNLLWHLPSDMAQRVAGAVWLLIPWPAAIAYRRLWQGILIRSGKSKRVALGTILRLAGIGVGVSLGLLFTSWNGAWIAAMALSAGVLSEMVAVRLWTNSTLRHLPSSKDIPLSYAQILSFYLPLLLTSILGVALTPFLTLLIAYGKEPILSLAAYSPTTSTIFLFSCLGVAYQEVVIVLWGTRVGRDLFSFAHRIAIGTTLALGILAFPGMYELWFGKIFGLPQEIQRLARFGLLCGWLMPAVVVYLSYLKGYFIWAHRTRVNLLAAFIELLGVFVIGYMLILGTSLVALYGALIGLLASRVGVVFMLTVLARRALGPIKRAHKMSVI
ncbi:MAG: hypothetical protein NZZ60_01330 [Bacteroidia bacterium]|nr:hypothetical protein [Bacteroidia bacterium]MCX7651743.1 hypothetical protein [Bacteroidia bacterium]MDW8416266.1 hypothetical protein [Bacteroidia bacterium]